MAEQQVDDFVRRFRAQFGRDGDQGVGAAGKIGGEVEGGGGGERDRRRGGVRPGWVARPWPPSAARRPQSRDPEFSSRSAARAAASAAGSRGRGRTPKGRGFRLRPPGRPGRRQKARAAALAAAETGSPSPAQAFRLARGRSGPAGQVEPRRRGGKPAGVEAGRPAGEVAPQPKQLRRGPARRRRRSAGRAARLRRR